MLCPITTSYELIYDKAYFSIRCRSYAPLVLVLKDKLQHAENLAMQFLDY